MVRLCWSPMEGPNLKRKSVCIGTTAGLAVALGGLSSCRSPLENIDDRAEVVIQDHLNLMGDPKYLPNASSFDPGEVSGPGQPSRATITDPNPRTTNPPADSLRFTQRDPDRSAAEVLARYTSLPDDVPRYDLSQTLAYAVAHAREYVTAKEDLFLAALNLMSERHLYGPRFF